MRARLSHCDRIPGCTFEGRCVESSSQSPNLRPSAAICTIRSRTATASGESSRGEQRLCASSITSSTGRRSSRRSQRSSSSESATTSCCSGVENPPRSSTVASGRSATTSVTARSEPAQTSHSSTPRFSMRSASGCWSPPPCSAWSIGSNWSSSPAATTSCRCTSELYSSRSATGSRRSTAALDGSFMSMKRARSAVSSSPRRAEHPDVALRERLGGRAGGVGVELAEPHEVGVRVEDHDRQRGVRHDLLEHDAERVGLARAALPAPERVAVEPSRQQLRRAARHRSGSCRPRAARPSSRAAPRWWRRRPPRPCRPRTDGCGRCRADPRRARRSGGRGGARAASPSAPRRAPAAARRSPRRRRATRRRGSSGGVADEEGAAVVGAGDGRVLGIHAPIIPLLARDRKTEALEESVTVPDLSIRVAGPADAAALAELAADTFPLACPPSTTAEAIAAFIAANFTVERMAEYLADRRPHAARGGGARWPRRGLLDAHRRRAGRCGCRGLRRRAAGDRAQQVLHACARARLGGRRGSAHERDARCGGGRRRARRSGSA